MSDSRIRVLVLYGGRSSEHSISCVSAAGILDALDRAKYEVVCVGITQDGAWVRHPGNPEDLVIRDGVLPVVDPDDDAALLSLDPQHRGLWFENPAGQREWQPVDVAFPVLHGPYGEDGAVQGVFETAAVPYVGSGVLASAACMDKVTTKRLLADAGIPAGDWQGVHHRDWVSSGGADVVAGLGWPLFVKPARAGSSVGVSKVHDVAALDRAVAEAARHDPRVIVEASVEGAREIECGVLVGADGVPRASVCAEIAVRAGHDFYDFEAKYLDDSCDLIVPADLPPAIVDHVRDTAVRAFRALGCEGLARVDFFVARDGTVLVNEINTMPGFTPISMYPRMWQESGVSYAELVDTLLTGTLARSDGLR